MCAPAPSTALRTRSSHPISESLANDPFQNESRKMRCWSKSTRTAPVLAKASKRSVGVLNRIACKSAPACVLK